MAWPDSADVEYDFAGTIEQALRWHPQARQLIVVTGASERDREFEARLRREVPPIVNGVSVEFLAGLPSATLLKRLSVLGADSLVFTPGFFECTTAFSTDLPVGWPGHNG